MELDSYFDGARGTGVLATADGEGRVNVALYARPHAMEDGTIAFIMADRQSRKNLEQNPHAAYLFQREGTPREGVRLTLTRVGESSDPELIARLRRRSRLPEECDVDASVRVVHFAVTAQRPLIGNAPPAAADPPRGG